MIKEIISRLLAVICISLPLTYTILEVESEEVSIIKTMNHSELVEYFVANNSTTSIEAFAMLMTFGVCFVATIESISFLFRWGWKNAISEDLT